MTASIKQKIVVLNPFAVYPPHSGGQYRVFYLSKYLADYFDIMLLCFSYKRSYRQIAPGLSQITIPKSPHHCKLDLDFVNEYGLYTCAVDGQFARYTPEFAYRLQQYIQDADLIILSHPYLITELEQFTCNAVVLYDAHNVELDLHQSILPNKAMHLLKDIYRYEQMACERSRLITTCSQADAARLASLYNIHPDKFHVVPNGAEPSKISLIQRQQRPFRQGNDNRTPVALFMGSDFPPNVAAVKCILAGAEILPQVQFVILGGVCNRFAGERLPTNLTLYGIVDEQTKLRLLNIADLALNPVSDGSGTCLKMLEYMAAGLPVVTTVTGARGIDGIDGTHFAICDCDSLPATITHVLRDAAFADSLAAHAHALVKTKFNWQKIAENLMLTLKRR